MFEHVPQARDVKVSYIHVSVLKLLETGRLENQKVGGRIIFRRMRWRNRFILTGSV
jgi:hypothetical protein